MDPTPIITLMSHVDVWSMPTLQQNKQRKPSRLADMFFLEFYYKEWQASFGIP